MGEGGVSGFSAAEAALGYLYQVRVALLWTLQRLKANPDFLIGVETIDDVAFETMGGEPPELLQTKHHKGGTGSLTNASADLWKTLRVWFEGITSGLIPNATTLYLMTTAEAPVGSAASHLRVANRDVSTARGQLAAAAMSSTNMSNRRAYEAFLGAGQSVQEDVLGRVVVLDASPGIVELDGELAAEVYWAAGREHHGVFLERLEGWWFRRVLLALAVAESGWIGSVELEAKMSDLREQFMSDALPVDDDLLEFSLDEETRRAHEDSLFVKQIELTRAGKQRISAAIRDYYRAFEQRSRWLRDELVFASELCQYEKRLVEEWELTFEAVRDELGDEATEKAKRKAGRSVLSWAEQTLVPIRPNAAEPFVGRGSLHMLSDELRVGWHVDFYERLFQLLAAEAP